MSDSPPSPAVEERTRELAKVRQRITDLEEQLEEEREARKAAERRAETAYKMADRRATDDDKRSRYAQPEPAAVRAAIEAEGLTVNSDSIQQFNEHHHGVDGDHSDIIAAANQLQAEIKPDNE